MDISKVMRAIGAKWPWTDANYHGYDDLPTERDRELFRLNHVFLHLSKSLGLVAAALERLGHDPSDPGPSHASRVQTCGKLLVLVLQLADQSGVAPDELEAWISRHYPQPADVDG